MRHAARICRHHRGRIAFSQWLEACLQPWQPYVARSAPCHPKGRSEAEEPRSGLTR